MPDADAVLGSGDAATPLTKLMMARPRDGAVAVLIARDDIAARAARTPVTITGMGSSMDRHAFASRDGDGLASCAAAARMAFGKAGWSAAQADVAEVSGSSVVGELLAIEAIGLADAGAGRSVATEGKTAINRSGGALPADPIMATGLLRLAHAARQLTTPGLYGLGAGGGKAIVHGAGGVGMQNNCVFTLEV